MKERKRIDVKSVEVPLSSMIDVVFLLLIYFIVVQKPIIENTFLKADLPTTPPNGTPPIEPDIIRIDVIEQKADNDHFFYKMNNRWWKDENLFGYLEEAADTNKKATVVINCGPNAKHQKLVSLLDACSKAELSNINIVNDESITFDK